MNAPAKRFSLQRLLTSPAPAPASMPAPAPFDAAQGKPVIVAPLPEVAPPPMVAAAPVLETPAPLRAVPAVPPRVAKAEEESHPKKKRSYSVDMKLCEDLEILAWYMSRSSSSVVEELIRKHLQHNKSVLLKAREVRSAR
jgi:hypothetical protein